MDRAERESRKVPGASEIAGLRYSPTCLPCSGACFCGAGNDVICCGLVFRFAAMPVDVFSLGDLVPAEWTFQRLLGNMLASAPMTGSASMNGALSVYGG